MQAGGAEAVLLSFARLFPTAPIYTAIPRPWEGLRDFRGRDVRTLWPDRLPVGRRSYRAAVLAYAGAFEGLDLAGYDLVISSSSGFAKSAGAGARHRVCYCHTPPRFLWPMGSTSRGPALERVAMRPFRTGLRRRDLAAAARVDRFIVNSQQTGTRVRAVYGAESTIVHPPVDVDRLRPLGGARDGYLTAGRLVAYKRQDEVIRALTTLGRPLTVVGDGRDRARLEALAGPSVRFLGHVGGEAMPGLYSGARAVVVAGEEDWGMVPLEANACGAPVIAAAHGGNLESVVDGVTGILYEPGSPSALVEAIKRFETMEFSEARLRAHAEDFSEARFHERILRTVDEVCGISATAP